MEAIRLGRVVQKDGELRLNDLPCKKGQRVELIVLIEPEKQGTDECLTARELLDSGLAGIWKDRTDISDSATYARQLREQAQRRR